MAESVNGHDPTLVIHPNGIELIPTEAENHPIAIEVGPWGRASAGTWPIAEPVIVYDLTLVFIGICP